MRLVPHPLVTRDIDGIVDHILAVTGGDIAAAERRLDEIDALTEAILANAGSGVRLSPPLEGWLVRHGGRDQMITAVFRPDAKKGCVYLAVIAFGGRNWLSVASSRRSQTP